MFDAGILTLNVILFSSFSNGNSIFTVMMGGRWFSATLGDDPSVTRVEELAVEHLQRIIRHDKAPVRYVFHVQSHSKKKSSRLRELASSKYRLSQNLVGHACMIS